MTAQTSDDPAIPREDLEQDDFKTLKYHLLGPSLTKAGQDKVDQSKVCPQYFLLEVSGLICADI